mmetsp:Transcript_24700/g.83304  ORF Transcript_24700/g.83304 Transcript_24700/m.83304 type:complete len:302 (+) Transcript_24700:3018-3923(+)
MPTASPSPASPSPPSPPPPSPPQPHAAASLASRAGVSRTSRPGERCTACTRRVWPGCRETLASLRPPQSALNSDDLPTLQRPSKLMTVRPPPPTRITSLSSCSAGPSATSASLSPPMLLSPAPPSTPPPLPPLPSLLSLSLLMTSCVAGAAATASSEAPASRCFALLTPRTSSVCSAGILTPHTSASRSASRRTRPRSSLVRWACSQRRRDPAPARARETSIALPTALKRRTATACGKMRRRWPSHARNAASSNRSALERTRTTASPRRLSALHNSAGRWSSGWRLSSRTQRTCRVAPDRL